MSKFDSSLLVIICVCDLTHMNHDKELSSQHHYLFLPETQTAFIIVDKLKKDLIYFISFPVGDVSYCELLDCGWKFILCAFFLRVVDRICTKDNYIHTLSGSTRDNYLYRAFLRPGDHNQAPKLILLKSQTVHDINNSVLIIHLLVGHLSLVRAKNILHNSTEFVTTDTHW